MATLFSDNFNRANGALGANWSTIGGSQTAVIASNQLSMTYSGTGSIASTCWTTTSAMAAVADCKISITRITGGGFDGGPLARRQAAADTCYYLDVYGTNNVDIYRRVAAVDTLLGSRNTTHAANDVYSLQVSGTGATVTIKAFKTGVQMGADLTDSNAARIVAAGQGGVLCWSSAALAYDDFLAESLSGAPYTIACATAAYAVSGTAVALKQGHSIAAASASYGLTGTTVALRHGFSAPLASGSFALTGTALAFPRTRRIATTAGAYGLTGTTLGLLQGHRIAATAAAYVVNGSALGLLQGRRIATATAAYAVNGSAANLARGRVLAASTTSYSVNGTTVSLKTGRVAPLASGSYGVAGATISLRAARLLPMAAGAYGVTGAAAALRFARLGQLVAGSYQVTGTAFAMRQARLLGCASGAYALAGAVVALVYQPAGHFTLACNAGGYAVTGSAAALIRTRIAALVTGGYALTGANMSLIRGRLLPAQVGGYVLNGASVTLTVSGGHSYTINLASQAYLLTGSPLWRAVPEPRRIAVLGPRRFAAYAEGASRVAAVPGGSRIVTLH